MERINRDSFVFYKSFYEASKYLSLDEKWQLFDMICQYGLYGNELETDWPSMWMFLLIKPQLDANNKRFLNWQKWWEFGSLGWRPKKNWDNSQKPQTNPTQTPNVNVNVNDNVNDNVNENVNENELEKKLIKRECDVVSEPNGSSQIRGSIEKTSEWNVKFDVNTCDVKVWSKKSKQEIKKEKLDSL